MSMKDSLSYVDDSLIHGNGLFARKYIGAGEIIVVLDGIPTSTDGAHAGMAAMREFRAGIR